MSCFEIHFIDGGMTTVDDVFLDERDGWLLFRETKNSGPERVRVNRDHVTWVRKIDVDG